jgi:uncharacterized repeat protein (TIGR01451 family)
VLFLLFAAAVISAAPVQGAQSFVYVANGGSNNVSAYTIVPISGWLAAVSGSPFAAGSGPVSVTADPAGKFAYVANLGSGNVSAYTINPATGALAAVSGSPFSTGTYPISVTVDPTGQFAYVANNNYAGSVSAFAVDPATGALTAVLGSPFSAGAFPYSITVGPTGRVAYVVNSGSDNVSAFAIDPTTGALTAAPGSPFAAGSVPYSIAVDPTGRFAYVANSNSGNVSAYTIDPASGALAAMPGSPFAVGYGVYFVTVDPTGRFLYAAASGGEYSIGVSAYDVDPVSGALAAVSSYSCLGGLPTSIAVDPTDRFAYGLSYEVCTFNINPATGALGGGNSFAAGSNPKSIVATSVYGPALRIAKSHGGTFSQGQNGVAYAVTVSNTGAGPTTGTVTMAEWVPAGLTLVSMAGSGWTCPGGGPICYRGDLLSAGSSYPAVAVTMNVANNAPASLSNVVSASTVGSAMAIASDSTSILPPPSLTVSSSHTGDFFQGQASAKYSISVTNTGGPTSGPVTVTETVPSGLVLVSLVGGTGWTCASGGTYCTWSDPLDAGVSYPAITATVNVAHNAPASVTNQVTAAGGGSATATASDATTINNLCDIRQYGTTTVADVQRIINEGLGTASPADDLNQDGVVNVVDAQIVINSALGLGCWGS